MQILIYVFYGPPAARSRNNEDIQTFCWKNMEYRVMICSRGDSVYPFPRNYYKQNNCYTLKLFKDTSNKWNLEDISMCLKLQFTHFIRIYKNVIWKKLNSGLDWNLQCYALRNYTIIIIIIGIIIIIIIIIIVIIIIIINLSLCL